MSHSLTSGWLRQGLKSVMGLLLAGISGLYLLGDGGLSQHLLTGAEQRALAHRSTLADRLGLRMLYTALLLGGRVAYPQAAELLAYYRDGGGDTLRFDAQPLLQHPEVQQALRQHRPGITFRHQASAGPFQVVRRTDWPLYYAFDLLYIKQVRGGVAFYDNYFFQPVARRSYTSFRFGRLHLKLNDGLIRVAYPGAKAFIAYGEAIPAKPVALAR